MLPVPSRIENQDVSAPVQPWNQLRPEGSPRKLPFAPSSRIIVTQTRNTASAPPNPLTSLILSLPLAQKIHNLILTSRQIEMYARGVFHGTTKEDELRQRIDYIESRYSQLREDVECELETAWVNAGLIPAALPNYPVAGLFKKAHDVIAGNEERYTVDRDLKRKREEEQEEEHHGRREDAKHRKIEQIARKDKAPKEQARKEKARKEKTSKKKTRKESSPQGRWIMPTLVRAIGVTKAMESLDSAEKYRLRTWNFDSAWGTGEAKTIDGEDLSPRTVLAS